MLTDRPTAPQVAKAKSRDQIRSSFLYTKQLNHSRDRALGVRYVPGDRRSAPRKAAEYRTCLRALEYREGLHEDVQNTSFDSLDWRGTSFNDRHSDARDALHGLRDRRAAPRPDGRYDYLATRSPAAYAPPPALSLSSVASGWPEDAGPPVHAQWEDDASSEHTYGFEAPAPGAEVWPFEAPAPGAEVWPLPERGQRDPRFDALTEMSAGSKDPGGPQRNVYRRDSSRKAAPPRGPRDGDAKEEGGCLVQ